jgi:tetratricopeptide (TPR) repeat protein
MPRLQRHWPALLLLLSIGAVYGRVVGFPFVNWDDPIHVYRNPSVVRPDSLPFAERWFPRHLGYPMPLVMLSYRMDRAIYGPSAEAHRPEQGRGYHASNLLFMLLLAVVAYRLCLSLVPIPWAAAAGAAVFALHPLSVETVAWITGRKEILAALFSVAGAALWLEHLRKPEGIRWLGFVGCALLGLASKPTAVWLVPFSVWATWAHRPSAETVDLSQRWRTPLALALVAAAGGLILAVSLKWQWAKGAIAVPQGAGSTLRRALWAFGFHVHLIGWPAHLRAKYLYEPARADVFDAVGLLALLGLAVLLVHPRFRRSVAAYGAAMFLAAYLPSSSLVPLKRYLSDTYLFIPLVGVAVMMAGALAWLHGATLRLSAPWLRLLARASSVVPLAVLATLALVQTGFWRDSEAIWRRAMRFHPDNAIVCRMLGEGMIENGQPARAVQVYRGCISRFGLGPYANNLAIAYFLMGDFPRARDLFQGIAQRRPGDPRAHKYLRLIADAEQRAPRNEGPRR